MNKEIGNPLLLLIILASFIAGLLVSLFLSFNHYGQLDLQNFLSTFIGAHTELFQNLDSLKLVLVL